MVAGKMEQAPLRCGGKAGGGKPACRMTCRPLRMFTVPSGTHVCLERRILPAVRTVIIISNLRGAQWKATVALYLPHAS